MSNFMDELANAKVFGSGNKFTAGRGVLIVKDVKIFQSNKPGGDTHTWVAEFLVKESHPTVEGIAPNAPGTSVSTVQQLTRAKYPELAKSNAQVAHLAILGPGSEALQGKALADALTTLLRPLPAGNPLVGRTDPSKPCPARGYQVAYETVKGKGANGGYYPTFTAIETTDADLATNLKLLAGASE